MHHRRSFGGKVPQWGPPAGRFAPSSILSFPRAYSCPRGPRFTPLSVLGPGFVPRFRGVLLGRMDWSKCVVLEATAGTEDDSLTAALRPHAAITDGDVRQSRAGTVDPHSIIIRQILHFRNSVESHHFIS